MNRSSAFIAAFLLAATVGACPEDPPPSNGGDGGEGGEYVPVPASCGNYMVEAAEQCDGPRLDGTDCWDLGYADGDIACSARCAFDTSGCIPHGHADFSTIGPAICGWLTRCQDELGRLYESQSRCEEVFGLAEACGQFADAATQSHVSTCASWFGSAPCDPPTVDSEFWDPACFMVFTGEMPSGLGEICSDVDCEADLYCDWDADPCGLCLTRAGIGEACEAATYGWIPCDRGLYCDTQSFTCAAKLATGAECEWNDGDQCQTGFCRDGTCTELLANGAACSSSQECAGPFRGCADGLCTQLRGAGEPCMGYGLCVADAYCDGGVCVPLPLDPDLYCGEDPDPTPPPDDAEIGEDCSTRPCVPEAYCDWTDWTCNAVHRSGEACQEDWQCERNHYCGGVCLRFAGLGGSCSNGQLCTLYTYCDGTVCRAEKGGGEPCVFDYECVSYCMGGTCYGWDDEC